MASYTSATTSPSRYQWESNSLWSQSFNCGPTVITKIASFYKDQWYGIEATRKLIYGKGPYLVSGYGTVYGAPSNTPTQSWQQADMLRMRGVPCQVRQINSTAELHNLVDSGRRPVLIGIYMARVPSSTRDHPFLGWHAVCVTSGGWRDGVRGFYVNDPNFSPSGGVRPDPDGGRKFYPDWVLQNAWINHSPRYSVVPDRSKAIPTTSTTRGRGRLYGPGCNIRTSMSLTANNIFATSRSDGYTYRSNGSRLWPNSQTFYFMGWSPDKKWARCMTFHGTRFYIARSVFVVTRWP